jgi:hypothetical protein
MTERAFEIGLYVTLFYGFVVCWLGSYRWSKHD